MRQERPRHWRVGLTQTEMREPQTASMAQTKTRGDGLATHKLSGYYRSAGEAGKEAQDRGGAKGTEVQNSIS